MRSNYFAAYETGVDISVVIGFRDWGLRRIRLAVESIQASFGRFNGEVIISDYGSENQKENELLADKLGARYVYTPDVAQWSRSRALNAGFAISTGSLLVSTDADMVFSPQSFERIFEIALSQPKAAYFLQCRDLPQSMNDEWVEANSDEWQQMERNSRLRPRWGMGGMMAISRQGFFEIRGFDERFHTYGGEDLDFAQRARRAGFKTVWINDSAVRMYHMWHPPTRRTVDQTPEGRAAVENNRDMLYNDRSFVRNFMQWEHKPDDAPPLVTVAICTQNRAELIGESIQSVLFQSMQDFEVVVVDDGGSDNTREVVESFGDDRIRYVWQKNAGIAAARNHAARISRGLYTAVLDDDDLMHPRRLEWQIGNLKPGNVGNVGSFVNFDNELGDLELIVSKKPTIQNAMEKGTAPGHSTWMVRTDVVRQFQYDESLTSGVDNDLMLRMLRSGVTLTHIGKPLTLRRMHSKQVTVLDGDQQLASAGSALRFIQWRLNPGDLRNITEKAKQQGAYPQTAPREEIEREISLFLPDRLAKRNLALSGDFVSGASTARWQGDFVQASVKVGADDRQELPIAVIQNATFQDMVTARRCGLDFSASPAALDDECVDMRLDQLARMIEGASVATADLDLKPDFVLAKRDGDRGASNTIWDVRVCMESEAKILLKEDKTWLIFGNEFWGGQIENNEE